MFSFGPSPDDHFRHSLGFGGIPAPLKEDRAPETAVRYAADIMWKHRKECRRGRARL